VVACIRIQMRDGQVELEKEWFTTTQAGLAELTTFLMDAGVTTIAMEATGVYWRAVYYALEGLFPELWLCNAQHVKNVPGRTTSSAVKILQWRRSGSRPRSTCSGTPSPSPRRPRSQSAPTTSLPRRADPRLAPLAYIPLRHGHFTPELPEEALSSLNSRVSPMTRKRVAPEESTIRRMPSSTDLGFPRQTGQLSRSFLTVQRLLKLHR